MRVLPQTPLHIIYTPTQPEPLYKQGKQNEKENSLATKDDFRYLVYLADWVNVLVFCDQVWIDAAYHRTSLRARRFYIESQGLIQKTILAISGPAGSITLLGPSRLAEATFAWIILFKRVFRGKPLIHWLFLHAQPNKNNVEYKQVLMAQINSATTIDS